MDISVAPNTQTGDLNAQPLVVKGEVGDLQNEQDKFFDFQLALTHLKRLIQDWLPEESETHKRRKERKVEVNVETLRQRGDLDEDETIVPIRVIDSNIIREQPPYINYLKNSRRLAIFKCLSDPEQDTDLLEQCFTEVCTYTGWEIPHYKCLDGSQAHGWDAVEVVRDLDKPGNFSIEHVGHDKLYFPRSAIDIQKCPRLIRAYDVTILQLQDWITKYNFSKEQVDRLRATRKDSTKEAETIRVYKLFFKKDSVVYVSWFATTDGVDDWLMAPAQLYLGIEDEQKQPKPINHYPIFILPYRLTEEHRIVDARGRGFLDCYKQEAYTALWSAFINGMNRASGIYGSPSQEDGTGASLKEVEDIKLTSGRFLNRPVNFWHPDYPDPVVLRTLQYADSANSEETNQVNFAAMNREDSRKTAKEIGAAENQQQLLNSVQLTLFSTFIRQVYSFVWLIVQSQAVQNEIRFLLIKTQQPVPNPITGQPVMDPQTQQPQMKDVWINNMPVLQYVYSVRAAGDVDVIQKQEIIQNMQQDFNLVMNTPLKDQFTLDYFKLKYPERADTYAQILQQANQQQAALSLIAQLEHVLEGLLKDHPEDLDNIPSQQRSDLSNMMMQAKQMTQQQTPNAKPA